MSSKKKSGDNDLADKDPNPLQKRRRKGITDATSATRFLQRVQRDCARFSLVSGGKFEEFKKSCNGRDVEIGRNLKRDSYLHCALAEILDSAVLEKMVNYILTQAPDLLWVTNNAGQTPLCTACMVNIKLTTVELLITKMKDRVEQVINLKDNQGNTPLITLLRKVRIQENDKKSVTRNNDIHFKTCLNIVQLLLSNNADVKIENNDNNSALFYCFNRITFMPHQANIIAILLLRKGARLTNNVWTSIEFGPKLSLKFLRVLIELYPNDINVCDVKNSNNNMLQYYLFYSIYQRKDRNAILKLLLHNGAQASPGVDLVKIGLEGDCNFEVMEMLLEKSPQSDINMVTYSMKNKVNVTLLIKFGTNTKAVKKLLSLGADPNLNVDNVLPLHVAVEGTNFQAMKLLIEAGADPLKTIECGADQKWPVLSLRRFLNQKPKNIDHSWFKVLKYILSLPQFQESIVNNTKLSAFYSRLILDMATFYKKVTCNTEVFTTSLHLIIDSNKSILNLEHEFPFQNTAAMLKTNTIGFIITHMNVVENFLKCRKFIYLMHNVGFSVKNHIINNNCVTPLTLLMSLPSTSLSLVDKSRFVDWFIKEGVNIESMAAGLAVVSTMCSLRIAELKIKLWLPDTLLCAFKMESHVETIQKLLPYWWAPPLVLLIFHPGKISEIQTAYYVAVQKMCVWLPMLMTYGGVPHGTPIFKEIVSIVKEWHYESLSDSSQYFTDEFRSRCVDFNNIIKTPLSLQELCKYVVRQSVAARASHDDTSLPKLLHQILPPLLRPVVIH